MGVSKLSFYLFILFFIFKFFLASFPFRMQVSRPNLSATQRFEPLKSDVGGTQGLEV